MKHLFKIGIALLLAFAMTSCEKEDIKPDEQTTKTEETNKYKWTDYIQSFEIIEVKELSLKDAYEVYYIESREVRSAEGETWYYMSGWGIVNVIPGQFIDTKLMVKKNDKITFRNQNNDCWWKSPSSWISSENSHNEIVKTDQEKWDFYCKCSFIRDFDTLLEDIRNNRNRGVMTQRDLSQF